MVTFGRNGNSPAVVVGGGSESNRANRTMILCSMYGNTILAATDYALLRTRV